MNRRRNSVWGSRSHPGISQGQRDVRVDMLCRKWGTRGAGGGKNCETLGWERRCADSWERGKPSGLRNGETRRQSKFGFEGRTCGEAKESRGNAVYLETYRKRASQPCRDRCGGGLNRENFRTAHARKVGKKLVNLRNVVHYQKKPLAKKSHERHIHVGVGLNGGGGLEKVGGGILRGG